MRKLSDEKKSWPDEKYFCVKCGAENYGLAYWCIECGEFPGKKEAKMLNLKLKNVDTDNNRIYFTAAETDGIYCLKEEVALGKRFFSLNRCLQDGEPSHKIDIEVVGSIEAPKSSEPIVNSFFRGTLS